MAKEESIKGGFKEHAGEGSIDVIRARFDRAKAALSARMGRRDLLREDLARLEASKEIAEAEENTLDQVRVLLQKAAEYAREQARQQIEMLVTTALQSVFGEDIRFVIETTDSRGRTEAEFYVSSCYGGMEVKARPEDARGGGVVDVVSLALRLAMLQSYREPTLDGPVVLDEPAKHVSEDFIINVAQFLRGVSLAFGRQVIMVTHEGHLSEVADCSYRIELREGRSVVARNFPA